MMDIKEMVDDYDWQEAFDYASNIRTATGCESKGFLISDVTEILAKSEGENDGDSWMMVGKLSDGRYFFLEAWCDYTGWDCQSGGDAQVADSLSNLVLYGMTSEARERLGYAEPSHE